MTKTKLTTFTTFGEHEEFFKKYEWLIWLVVSISLHTIIRFNGLIFYCLMYVSGTLNTIKEKLSEQL